MHTSAEMSSFAVQCCAMKRRYELKRRAEKLGETRNRIVEATVDLHTTMGPARTTISAIAERAGVQRHTVYAHFPSERELLDACSSHWAALHPFPDAAAETGTAEPAERLRAALDAVYAWYDDVGADLDIFARDAKVHESTALAVQRRLDRTLELRDRLSAGWPRRKAVLAAIGHALELETWHSLVRRQGLTRKQAVDAMVRFVASV
jgi:AcrR family transcriptional regulator